MCKAKCLRRDHVHTNVETPVQLWLAAHVSEAAQEGGDAG